MTTPRVTVPVEPTREMWAAGANAVVGYKQRHHDKVVEQVWTAMLSAAPAPEGGAVSGAFDRIHRLAVEFNPDIQDIEDTLSEINQIALNALATREEAPAEAGEPKYFAAFMAEDGALRAQPQAREDTRPVGLDVLEGWEDPKTPSVPGPVAWRCRNIGGVWSYGEAKQPNVAFCEPLYDHPAPDALRAIEMLRASEGDSVTILCDNPEATDLDDAMAVVCCGPWTDWKDRRFYGRDVSDALSKALAALKAEQKGGA